MTSPFARQCVAYAQRLGVTVDDVIDTGAQNCVVLTNDGATVHRFPRFDPERLPEVIARYERISELGLPAAQIEAVEHGEPGVAHLVLRRETGTPWREAIVELDGAGRQRAAQQMAELLLRSRSVTSADWPFANLPWSQLWSGLQDQLVNPAEQADISAADHDQVADALATAEQAPLGLIHGDLAWGNILLSDAGDITAVLDWDFAVIADPAIDVAAVLYEVPDEMTQAFVEVHPHVDTDLQRFASYLATWDLQHRLWQQQPVGDLRPPHSVETAR